MWIGTQNGLVKYNGYTMQVYQPEPNNPNSISQSGPNAIYEDSYGVLWIGTSGLEGYGGLNSFDRTTEKFTRYLYDSTDGMSLSSNAVYSIVEDNYNRIWVGTDNALNLLDRKTRKFERFYLEDLLSSPGPFSNQSNIGEWHIRIYAIIVDSSSGNLFIGASSPGLWMFDVKKKIFFRPKFSDNNIAQKIGAINFLHKAKDGFIWIASTKGLANYNPVTYEINVYRVNPSQGDKYANNFQAVTMDAQGIIWTGGELSGLYSFDTKVKKFQAHKYNANDSQSLSGNKVWSIYEDNSGILWIGTWGRGLNKWDRKKWKFSSYQHKFYDDNSLIYNSVNSIYEDNDGQLWIATDGGLDKFIRSQNKFIHYKHDPQNTNTISGNRVSHIVADNFDSNVLWIGTIGAGLNKFKINQNSFTRYEYDPQNVNTISDSVVTSILQEDKRFLWLATWNGLNKFDKTTGRFQLFKHNENDPGSLSQDQVQCLYKDESGVLWIGTNLGGLNRFEPETGKFISYKVLIDNREFTSVSCIYEDSKKNFWVGTVLDGLCLFDRTTGELISFFTQNDGLPNNAISYMLEDDNGKFWISTCNGLSKFDPESKKFRNFDLSDGLSSTLYHSCAALKTRRGEMFFGGDRGVDFFHPDSIKDDPVPPQVIIEKITLFNRPKEKLSYEGYIPDLEIIELSYDQNDLSFQYVGFHYGEPLRNQYKYILEGFDEKWIDAGNQRTATYTNLDPGEYIFRVTASNRDGVWTETDASIKIIILPPWWATIWAYLFYALLFISSLYFFWKLQLKRIRVRHEFEMSRFEAQKLHEVDEIKSRFFTNISHEFRTPLTLILGPVKQIIERTKEEKTRDDLKVVHKSAKRLLGLVNQLLDISKLESGNMKLQSVQHNIIPLLKALALSFTSYAERKRITLKFNSPEDEITVYLDKDKVEKIITNILSNAFKFTPEGGRVEVTASRDNKYVNVIVSDTGIGIPKEKMSKIFDRFYQVDGSHTREQEGTGIGLSLTKELVELHRGKIEVESEEGKGTTVTISLPLGKEHLKPEEIRETEQAYDKEKERPVYYEEIETKSEYKVDIESFDKESLPLLLIVEDNSDVRKYIRDNLVSDYRILEAVDGEDGWNKSVEQLPDLIVSDVMMPKLDGFELCKKLRTDERTSHIPVILLTAKAAKQDKIEGYETGADEYIMKPFEPDELRARIKNLIEQRKRLHEHFQRKGIIDLGQSNITSFDKKFLQKAFDIITQKISDSSFTVEAFADNLAVSRSLLHKKIVALTGEAPRDLIRRIRLRKAAELIEKKFGNLSEIALEVGFNNPAYFSEAFKKQFGISPSQYQQKNTNN
jgi:signal transduction histidine kinase/ligand-binding sensor domain-containing protein/DNA-binding response OmpR family regulator